VLIDLPAKSIISVVLKSANQPFVCLDNVYDELFVSHRDHRFDSHCSPRRNITRKESYHSEHHRDGKEC
jgi:hypothetical protein